MNYNLFNDLYNSILDGYLKKTSNKPDVVSKALKLDCIKGISYCDEKGKEKVIVLFKDGSKIIKKPAGGDDFDLNVGVALCLAEYIFGSKSQYHKEIQRKLVTSKKAEGK